MSRSKNILFIVPLPPPVHGAALRYQSLVESTYLNSLFNIEVIGLHFVEELSELGRFSIKKVFKGITIGFRIVRKIMGINPDFIYFNLTVKGFAFYRDAFYIGLVKLLGKRALLHLRTSGIQDQIRESRFKRRLFRRLFRNNNVICLSKALSRDIQEVKSTEPYIVSNGIDFLEGYGTMKKTWNETPTVLFLGNFLRSKGILELLEAFFLVKQESVNFSALIVGNPIDLSLDEIEEKIAELGISDKVKVLPALYGMDKTEIYNSSDIFVLPTYFEAFPGVVLEAMQMGLPVISTCEGAIPEIVEDGFTGILVEKRDARKLAAAMKKLLMDRGLISSMGERSRERFLKNYTLGMYEKNIANVFEQMLNQEIRS